MRFAILVLAALWPATLQAQVRADSGYYLAMLGRDTVSFERYVRTPTLLRVHQMTRLPEARLVDLTVRWDESGKLLGYEHSSQAVPGTGGAAAVHTVVTVIGDSIRTEVNMANNTPRVRTTPLAADIPFINLAYSLYEVALQRALSRRAPEVHLLVPQGRLTYKAEWSNDTLKLSHPQGGVIRIAYDRNGRMTMFDGAETTFKVLVRATEPVDIDAIAHAFALRERATGALGTLSPRDTARTTVDGVQISIDYGRPAMRGRVIFGNIVPWDRVWRTGANAATQLEINRAIEINGVAIPPGKYSLWTVPGRNSWQLIVNKQTGQWGTDYDPAQDLARIEVRTRTPREAVERFTVQINRQEQGGVILMTWEKTQLIIPFLVK